MSGLDDQVDSQPWTVGVDGIGPLNVLQEVTMGPLLHRTRRGVPNRRGRGSNRDGIVEDEHPDRDTTRKTEVESVFVADRQPHQSAKDVCLPELMR